MKNQDLVSASKFLSLVLRHAPETIGLNLDKHGWANVGELLTQAARHGKAISLAELKELVAASDKQRFSLSEDGLSIRANQGHSISSVDLALLPATPPATLYHGTTSRFIDSIKTVGLIPGLRNHVHLSLQMETAMSVGGRHGKPIILTLRAAEMHQQGHQFYLSENGVWLTAAVPVSFIDFPED